MRSKILFISFYIVINCSFLMSQNDTINESKFDKKYQSDYTDARLLMSNNKFEDALNLLKK
jgi:hypothetical protein